jgi:hypothetical protein
MSDVQHTPPQNDPLFHSRWQRESVVNRFVLLSIPAFLLIVPSANFLLTQGIQRVLLVQRERTEPQLDLAHVLCRWQEGGVTLERMRIEQPAGQERFQVKRPSWFGAMFQRALASLGQHRAAGGGFGAWMHESPTAG